jgi:hypothetical protein
MPVMRASRKYLLLVLASAAAIVLVLILFQPLTGKRTNVQPLEYSHKVHIENAGLNCTDCHQYVEKLAAASIPSTEVCQNCHSESPISNSPEEAKLLKYVEQKKEVPWVRIYRVPDHVYFSHRRHVVDGKLKCSECHGNVGSFVKPVSSAAVPVTMQNCINCHKQRNVTTDCLSCHR